MFDGISCGRLAFERAGITIGSYSAFEIDKYAKSISRYNYSDIEQYGNVLDADFKRFIGYDFVIGGSPCTFWSIAKANREVDKDGIGWQLFMGFVNAVRIIKPKYFLYENVASMPDSIRTYITEELEVSPVLINSALVSAQQRKRLFWTNIKSVIQPVDKGILLRDILENCIIQKNDVLLTGTACKPIRIGSIGKGGQGDRIYSVHGKTVCISANGGGRGAKTGLYKVALPDDEYIVRKLTPMEAERCQTLPDNYTAFGIDDNGKIINISDTQRYKCVGNGWTVDVITHILGFINNKNLSAKEPKGSIFM